ncbi:hypothetical protein JEQ12_020408 [Ovis aries]|uniref:Uncharacterized protein n=1 Tax=Ovis aries TaxID=9940 RepID=A0A835ZLC0_SHEEP|nr:hypothetical protein JEQ12_020408 [Ovis aries]
MPKRKVTFQGVRDEDDEDDISVPKKKLVDPVAGVGGPGSRFEGKHSLDSDEKEKNDDEGSSKYDVLASEDVGGQEAATLSSDGGSHKIPGNERSKRNHHSSDSADSKALSKSFTVLNS